MSENNGSPPGNKIGGLIAGIIDVQTTLALAICNAGYTEPRQLAEFLLKISTTNAESDEQAGHLREYVLGRAFPAKYLAETLSRPGLQKKEQQNNVAKAPFDVILGGLSLMPGDGQPDVDDNRGADDK